jgi:hypothetical protein
MLPLNSCTTTQPISPLKTALFLDVEGVGRFLVGVRSPRQHEGFEQLAHP